VRCLAAVLLASVAALWLAAADVSAADKVLTKRVARGDVRAELTYVQSPSSFAEARSLRIVVRGTVVFSGKPLRGCRTCSLLPSRTLRIVDLDGDGTPEVALGVYTGGWHCCDALVVYRKDGARYVEAQGAFGGSSEERDLDGDGRPEFVGRDDRFSYLFTPYVASASPIRIWIYRQGKFVPKTRRFRREIRADAVELWRTLSRVRGKGDVRGILAAWVADKVQLRESDEAWARVNHMRHAGLLTGQGGPQSLAYVRALRRKLAAFGYNP
jgi:hypothetical protein